MIIVGDTDVGSNCNAGKCGDCQSVCVTIMLTIGKFSVKPCFKQRRSQNGTSEYLEIMIIKAKTSHVAHELELESYSGAFINWKIPVLI